MQFDFNFEVIFKNLDYFKFKCQKLTHNPLRIKGLYCKAIDKV